MTSAKVDPRRDVAWRIASFLVLPLASFAHGEDRDDLGRLVREQAALIGVTMVDDAGSMVPVTHGSPLRLGSGYDDLSKRLMKSALLGDPLAPRGPGREKTGVMQRIAEIQFAESFRTTLDSYEMAARASVGAFGWGAKLATIAGREARLNTYSAYLTVNIRMITNQHFLDAPRLTEEAVGLLEEGRSEEFYDTYGTHFVQGEIYGAALIGVLRVDFRSLEEKKTFHANLRAKGPLIQAGGKINKEATDYLSEQTVDMKVVRLGGSPESCGVVVSLDQLLELAADFERSAAEHPTRMFVSLQPYRICTNSPVGAPYVDVQLARLALSLIEANFAHAIALENDLQVVARHPDNFAIEDAERVKSAREQCLKAKGMAFVLADSVLSHPTDVETWSGFSEGVFTNWDQLRAWKELPPHEIPFREKFHFGSDRAVSRGKDTEMDSDDFTFTSLSYELAVAASGRAVDLHLVYQAREGNDDKSFGNTYFEIRATQRLYAVPEGDPRRIVQLSADPLVQKAAVHWFRGERHGWQTWKQGTDTPGKLGALSDLQVSFDRKGRNDLHVMAVQGTCAFSVFLR